MKDQKDPNRPTKTLLTVLTDDPAGPNVIERPIDNDQSSSNLFNLIDILHSLVACDVSIERYNGKDNVVRRDMDTNEWIDLSTLDENDLDAVDGLSTC